MGPLWDFDAAFEYHDTWSAVRNYPSLLYFLFQNETFRERYCKEWERIMPDLYSRICMSLDGLNAQYGDAIDLSRRMDALRWGDRFVSLQEEEKQRLSWLSDRIEWLNNALADWESAGNWYSNCLISMSEHGAIMTIMLEDEGYDAVRFAVWSEENGQDDLIWYNANRDSDGNWRRLVNTYQHGVDGLITVHVYVTKDGESCFLQSGGCYARQKDIPSSYTMVEWLNESDLKLSLTTDQNWSGIRFAVWSEEGGQDDLVWYSGVQDENDTWYYILPIQKHATRGIVNIHAYGIVNSERQFINGIDIQLYRLPQKK